MTLKDVLVEIESELKNNNIPSAHLDSQLLTAYVLHKSRAWILSNNDYNVPRNELKLIRDLSKQRQSNVPLSYILKTKDFYRRSFFCDKRVLVPRPESEQIITLALKTLPKSKLSIIDVGCGSGILGITAKLENPDWDVTLSDISKQALDVAKINVDSFKLSKTIKITHCDLIPFNVVYDVIFANLPYVPDRYKDKPDIMHEPKLALFAGIDGLDLYRRLFISLKYCKKMPSYIFLESLPKQHRQIIQIGNSVGYNLEKIENFIICLKKGSTLT